MIDIPNIRSEARYGMPVADQILFNRHYILGYSYYGSGLNLLLCMNISSKFDFIN